MKGLSLSGIGALDGFGNHDPGKGLHNSKIPFWGFLHPDRSWAEWLQTCVFTAEELEQRVQDYSREAMLQLLFICTD